MHCPNAEHMFLRPNTPTCNTNHSCATPAWLPVTHSPCMSCNLCAACPLQLTASVAIWMQALGVPEVQPLVKVLLHPPPTPPPPPVHALHSQSMHELHCSMNLSGLYGISHWQYTGMW